MELSEEEKEKLEQVKSIYNLDRLTREQINFALGRKLSNAEWSRYSGVSKVKRNIPVYKIPKFMFKEGKEEKSLWSKISKQAANKALAKRVTPEIVEKRKQRQQKKDVDDDLYFTKSLYSHTEDKYIIRKVNEYRNEKYKTARSEWKVYGDVDIFHMHSTIQELVDKMTEKLPENTKIQVSLVNARNDRTAETKLLDKLQITHKLSQWVNLFIDYYEMDIEDITFKLMAIEIPKGEGRRVNAVIDVQNKRSIIQVKNYDSMCLARSIVVALANNNKEKLEGVFKNNLTEAELKQINTRRQTKTQINDGILSDNENVYLIHGRKIQGVLAQALHRICGIPVKSKGNDLSDVKLFEEKMDIQIQVFNLEARKVYAGIEKEIKVYILITENHYDVISNLPGFKGTNIWGNETTRLRCKACDNTTKCDEKEPRITCDSCNKYFYGKACLDNHIKNKKCIEHSYICKKCCRFFKSRELKQELHKCDEVKCDNCKMWVSADHKCYMLQKELKPASDKYIFFDFETCLVDDNKHEVNFAVAQYYSGEEYVFRSIDEFCKWIFNKKHKGYTALAHYAKAYDIQFVTQWMVAHSVKPKIIHNGQKIIQLELKQDYNIRFIDSISFTLMPLRDFPKTFGLSELTKGFFPFRFNTRDNQDYVGSYPDKEHYGYDEMKKVVKEEFDKWYETTKDKVFDFKDEMYKYCKSDVDILRRGCIEYRKMFMQICDIDPFQYVTIASVCQAIYRKQYLPKDAIAIHNECGADSYSIKAIQWLKYVSLKENIKIKHACNFGEVTLRANGKRLKVDGYCEETKTVYQFHGCYFHGCKYCYNELTVNKVSRYNMKYLYERTRAVDNTITIAGYSLVTIWEHDFDRNKEMRGKTLDEYDLVEPPKFRENAFFGGRCEPVKLIYNFKDKCVKGKYIDVVSLYPTVMFFDKFPTGHPMRISKPTIYKFGLGSFIAKFCHPDVCTCRCYHTNSKQRKHINCYLGCVKLACSPPEQNVIITGQQNARLSVK